MEHKKFLSNSVTPSKDHEKGVCVTGKHRVININPMLLTPISASKIYAHTPKVSITENPDAPPTTVSNNTNSDSNSLPANSSMHTPTCSVSDSELTDTTDIASISELSNMSYDVKGGSDFKASQSVFPNSSDTSVQNDRKLIAAAPNQMRVFPNARRERTIELSPSLLLPVTAMPSNNHTLSNTAYTGNVSSGITQPKVNFHSGPRSTISASSSMSDLRGSRISIVSKKVLFVLLVIADGTK